MQADMHNGVFEVVATTDWCQLVSRHAATEADQIRSAALNTAACTCFAALLLWPPWLVAQLCSSCWSSHLGWQHTLKKHHCTLELPLNMQHLAVLPTHLL